jgi:hypothetical protein
LSESTFVPFVLFVVRINANERTGKNHEGHEDHGDAAGGPVAWASLAVWASRVIAQANCLFSSRRRIGGSGQACP